MTPTLPQTVHEAADLLLVAPLVLPLLGLGLALLSWQRPRLQHLIGLVIGTGLLVGAAFLQQAAATGQDLLIRLGGWAAPVGIPLGADPLSALLLILAAVLTCVTLLYTWGDWQSAARRPAFVPLLLVLITGVNGAFLTRDLFNLYVWFEVLLMGSFGLLIVTGGRAGREAAVKTLTLNLLGSLIFLLAIGVTYGLAGTLDMTELQFRLAVVHAERPGAVTGVAALLLVAFAMKAALFPFHFWLPASYHVPTAGVSALFAALLTKVGIYSILRILTLPFAAVDGLSAVLGGLAGVTMLMGVFGAATQSNMARILAWHSISQIGYMAAGLALLTAPSPEVRLAGVAATIFFVTHHGLVKPALFLVAGLVEEKAGTLSLPRLGGLHVTRPALAGVFLLAALSLAGIPPLSGFWAKLGIIQAVIAAGDVWLAVAALTAGLITLLSMVKIWNAVFWKPAPEVAAADQADQTDRTGERSRWAAVLILTLLITAIGLVPGPLLDLSRDAADSLIADRDRVATVLEVSR